MSSASSSSSSSSLKKYIEILIQGERHLTADEAQDAFTCILSKQPDPIQVGSLLTLLRARNETFEEIAGIVRAMNNACNAVSVVRASGYIPGEVEDSTKPKESVKLLDIVGTGGDGADTINISTAATVLAVACGCIAAKAGNRSVSSMCGSADVLETVGVKIDLQPAQIVECINAVNIAFLFAPINHPAMKYVAPIRKSLGIRTCFNIIGPLINAASAQHCVIGVFDGNLMPLMANALKMVAKIEHAVIIHGVGLDEISPLGPATILEIKNVAKEQDQGKIYEERCFEFDPASIGIPRCELIDLRGGTPSENAEQFRTVLLGGDHTNAKRDAVILNAGMGCYVYGLAATIEEGCQLARSTLYEGKATELLQKWITVSQEIASQSTS